IATTAPNSTSGWLRSSWPITPSPASLRSVEPVARVAEARHDEPLRLEPAVDRGTDDVHIGVFVVDACDPVGRSDDADEDHAPCAGLLDLRDRLHARVHRREHEGVSAR